MGVRMDILQKYNFTKKCDVPMCQNSAEYIVCTSPSILVCKACMQKITKEFKKLQEKTNG